MLPNRCHDLSKEQRERIAEALAKVLASSDEVLFAFVHGSVLGDLPFHDIDVAVFLAGETPGGHGRRALELERVLSDALRDAGFGGIAVDAGALNGAPVGFCYHASRGRLVANRDEVFMSAWRADVASRYLDSRPLRERALKEAMAA